VSACGEGRGEKNTLSCCELWNQCPAQKTEWHRWMGRLPKRITKLPSHKKTHALGARAYFACDELNVSRTCNGRDPNAGVGTPPPSTKARAWPRGYPQTRRGGASRWRKQLRVTAAHTSAPKPPVTVSSWLTTSRPVFRTDAWGGRGGGEGERPRHHLTAMTVTRKTALDRSCLPALHLG